ncbi:hypothetical protein PPEP_a4322 [Pseudoalteromonas peptidolytica F12-50-A1]|uniref:Uncharacterized protein n=1 Tax=Pseudoalteromonas peptidolytica F12-50-A1 TaxID=1315280 RepID=A0A8I0MYZ6_9GAMM|nr:hypothetical protein [Pseudoalteromonas peptidolytica F12-50-A1]
MRFSFQIPHSKKNRRIAATGLTYMDALISIRFMDECG